MRASSSRLATLFCASLLGCGGAASLAPEGTTPVSEPDPIVEPAAPVVEAMPPPDPCSDDAVVAFLATPAESVTSVAGMAAPFGVTPERADLDTIFAQARASGHRVVSTMRLDLGPANEPFVLAIATTDPEAPDDEGVLEEAELFLARCVAGEGFMPVGHRHLFDGAAPYFDGVERVERGGSVVGYTVRIREDLVLIGEHTTSAFLVTHPDVALTNPTEARPVPGMPALLGIVGRRFLADGFEDYTSVVPFDATDWYPQGNESYFVLFSSEQAPMENGRGLETMNEVTIAASLDDTTVRPIELGSRVDPVYFLVGTGARPALCTTNPNVRCADLTIRQHAVEGLRYTWAAGAFAVDDPSLRTIRVPGARWVFVGDGDDAPRRDPSGRAPLIGGF